MTAADKDTIYIDIDDEITGIIDKLRGSKGKIVALVLPKRAGVFQSIVNMKLLKRAADDSKKHLVLITSEAGLLPLAGAAGVHVAKTLNSKPEIPLAPMADDDEEEVDEETGDEPEITAATAGDKPIGELAGTSTVGADGVETLELDDDEMPEDMPSKDKSKPSKPLKPAGKKDKKLHVPNFERFRLLLVGGGLLLVLLIIGLVFALKVLPKATISIDTDASAVNTSATVNLSTAAKVLTTKDGTVPAKLVQQQKTYTQQTAATGQKNNGNKATGSITMTARECAPNLGTPNAVPAGTGVSANGLTYITQEDTVFSDSGHGTGSCVSYQATGGTTVSAQNGGANYNTGSGTAFSVAGRSGDVSASGSASGGTDSNVQIVTQTDINTAKAKINTDDSAIKQTLQNQLKQAGYYAILATYSTGTPTVTTSANAGDTANNVTVTEAVTYTMFGAKQSDLKTLVDNDIKDQIDTGKQSILDEGLDKAVFNVASNSATGAQLAMSTVATVGPDLDISSIKSNAAGKKPGEVKSDLGANPDVKSVDVKLGPFWVNSIPKKVDKITVNIAKPDAKASNNASDKP